MKIKVIKGISKARLVDLEAESVLSMVDIHCNPEDASIHDHVQPITDTTLTIKNHKDGSIEILVHGLRLYHKVIIHPDKHYED